MLVVVVGSLTEAAPESFAPLTLLRLQGLDALSTLPRQTVHVLVAAPLPTGWRSRLIELGLPFSILHEPARHRPEALGRLLQALADAAGRPSAPESRDALDEHVCGRCGHPHYERLGRACAPGSAALSLRRPDLLRLIDSAA